MLGEIADVNWGDTHTTKQSYSTTGFTAYSASGPDGLLPYADYDRTGIVLSAIGADCGKTWLAKGKWSCIKNTIRLFSKEDDVDTEFLYWATRDSDYWPKRGSAQPFISQGDARACVVRFPTISEQRAIAGVLRPLDDRIELNRRMNETLEAMARALFESWFVNFDPVRAKMEGWDPGLPPDIADLFPDRLVQSELGRIPEGWANGSLADLADSPRRIVDPRDLPRDTPYIGLEHMPRHSVALSEWGRATNVTSGKYSFEKGEVLFGKLRPYFHKVGIAPFHGVCSTDIVVLTPKRPAWISFVLACTSSTDFVGHSNRASTGTKMPRTSWRVMRTFPLCLPPETVARAFQRLAGPWIDRLVGNIHGRRTIASLSDALLPKLISGEVRLPTALVERYGETVTTTAA